MTQQKPSSGLTVLGKLFSVLLVLGLVTLGAWILVKRMPNLLVSRSESRVSENLDTSDLSETQMQAPRLGTAQPYVPQGSVIDIELSEYAGYAGLIVANGGLEPNNDSYFAKKHNITVRIKLSEEESWDALNSGKMAASATTADVLAVYGRQFQVVVPAQIGFSRGADGVLVRSEIKSVNDLKGKIAVAPQFTEADFFIRYLARTAGMDVKMLKSLEDERDPDAVNLVYTDDGFAAGDFFLKAVKANSQSIAGCVTWAPKTTEIPEASDGKARLLVSNKNLLIIADVLIVNRGFAEKNPAIVEGLVDGLLYGNNAVRENAAAHADVIGKAFKWDRAETLEELKKVHLSNLPEQLAFFGGDIRQGGSFASIYQSAVMAYGNDLIPNPVDSDRFLSLNALNKIKEAGTYNAQVAAITPITSGSGAPAETDPVLRQDIRFYFEPNSSVLDMKNAENLKQLNAIKRILDVSPGSRMILVGHVDNSKIPELRKLGGEELVQKTALEAMQLSKDRAAEVQRKLVEIEKAEAKRLETVGRGWMQPVSDTSFELNRRVEVQWFTLE